MTPERVREIYAEHFITNDGARLVGLHNRPIIAEAHDAALVAVVRAVREEDAKAMREVLDDCTHPSCVEDRRRTGYSSCAGGHLAKRVNAAIRSQEGK